MTLPFRIPSWLGWASLALPVALGGVARWWVDAPYVLAAGLTAPIAASNHDEVYAVRHGRLVAVDPYGHVVDRAASVPSDAFGLAADLEGYVAWTNPAGLTVWDTVRGVSSSEPFQPRGAPVALCSGFVVLGQGGSEVLRWHRGTSTRLVLPVPADRLLQWKDSCDGVVAVRGGEVGQLSLEDGAFQPWFSADVRAGWCQSDGCVLLEGSRIVRRERSGVEMESANAPDAEVVDLLDPSVLAVDTQGRMWIAPL